MNKQTPPDLGNLVLAFVLSAAVIFGWQYFVVPPTKPVNPTAHPTTAQQVDATAPVATPGSGVVTPANTAPAVAGDNARIKLDSDTIDGSIRLTGARFDDLRFKKYRETVDPKSPEVVFLAPEGAVDATRVEIGWSAGQGSPLALPTATTRWQGDENQKLTPTTPITLTWDNGQGLTFTRRIALDANYMFTVTDSVTNNTAAPVVLSPYAAVARHGEPKHQTTWVLHEGPVGVLENVLRDPSYSDVREKGELKIESTGGWVGLTDKYWMAAVVPPQKEKFSGRHAVATEAGGEIFRADYLLGARTVAPGASTQVVHNVFTGPKINSMLNDYQDKLGIARFDMAIDWGWFFFFTKPMFWLLDEFYKIVGNFGVAILLLTVVIKLILFPLANRSYESMSKMKKIQPQMKDLQDRYKDDRPRMQQELMELYRREKINPLMGCLPILVQIPVFFSLYKVLYVTIEMRHAPFFGWIQDLAAADPTSIFNLFGLLPFAVPHYLLIGVWPLLMGLTMWFQMKMNPPATDPVQQQMMTYMPLVFTYMMAQFPAGLVIYWTWNNLLSIVQQNVIMRRMGVAVDFSQNFKLPEWISKRLKSKPGEITPGDR